MARIVILGGGPTGLSAAYHLEKQGFFDYVMFEKEQTTGGLCRSVQEDGFTYDFTGHLLHINDDYFRTFINTITSLDEFNSIHRKSFIYSHDVYTKYPFQTNLYGLPPDVITQCITEYAQRPRARKNSSSFYQWVLTHFGRGIGTHFFFPYQEKIFSYDIKKVTSSWTGRFVPQTSLEKMILGALQEQKDEIGYNAQFFYPRTGGIQFWLDKLKETLKQKPQCGYQATTVDLKRKVVTFKNGHEEPFQELISTIPLDELLRGMNEPAHSSLKPAASKLKCNSVININLGIARENLTDKHWVYFPEIKYPFYRMGFYHNFAPSMVPARCSSLYAEFSYLKRAKNAQAQTDLSIANIKEIFKLSDKEIINKKILTIPHAYVIFDRWRDRNINSILQHLEQLHVHSVGRYGAWKYASMQEAILDGKKIAEKTFGELTHEASISSRRRPVV